MIIEIRKNFFQKKFNFNQIISLALLVLTFLLLIFFPDYGNPDYPSYLKLYKFGDYYSKLDLHQLSLFTLITSLLNNFLSYHAFRIILAILQILFFTYIFYKLKFKFLNATFFATLPVITFFLLKVHVQVRETLAIMLWMIAVLDIDKKNFFNLKNLFLFILSSFMHLSVLFWWIPSIIYSTKRFSNSIKLLLNSLFFGIVGTFAGSSLFKVFVDELLNNKKSISLIKEISKLPSENSIFIHGASITFQTVEINQIKILYWLSYFFLIFFIFLDERKNNISKFFSKINGTNLFGFIGLYGSIAFIPFAIIFSSIEGFTSHGYNYIFRILFILLFLLTFYRSQSKPKNVLTISINTLLFADIIRLIFYQVDSLIKTYLF